MNLQGFFQAGYGLIKAVFLGVGQAEVIVCHIGEVRITVFSRSLFEKSDGFLQEFYGLVILRVVEIDAAYITVDLCFRYGRLA